MSWGGKSRRSKSTESESYNARHVALNLLGIGRKVFPRKHIAAMVLISFLALIITIIGFLGQDLVWIQFIPNSKARMQIVAQVPFEYASGIKTQRLREQRRNLVAPVFRVDLEVYDDFESKIHLLDEMLDSFTSQKQQANIYPSELKKFVRGFNEKHGVAINWSDVDILLREIDECGRTCVLIEGLRIVKEICGDGILDQDLSNQQDEEYLLNIEIQGATRHAHYRSEKEASRVLKLRLFSVEASADVLQATYRILKTGLRADVVFDNVATNQKIARTIQTTPDVIRKVAVNDVIIEGRSIITPEDYECLLAYRNALEETHTPLLHANGNFIERLLFSFLVLLLAYLFFCTTRKDLKRLSQKEILLAILLLLLNLVTCRGLIWLFEWKMLDRVVTFMRGDPNPEEVVSSFDPVGLLPYVMPLTFSCLLGTLLIRTYVGTLLGILTSIFCTMILSQSIEFLVVSLIVMFVSVYFVRHAYFRAQVIRSGLFSGLIFALSAIIFAVSDCIPRETLFPQVLLAFANCLSISMIVLTILPIFENIFKSCTNICLIELADYRNPLLMKLQILAPGTYQHSLMVANLSEQTAVSIHANPFLCRVLAMYHDIGKLVKPEYFTENQGNHKNPHDEQTPFMSALVIKSHVKEGVALAKEARLPPRIIDGIVEHHGTSVIRYFYSKALKRQDMMGQDTSAIEKTAFKYDGPCPRSRETLILSLADSIEAASRSLYNPTPQSIQTLVDNIIDMKIEENQFDECQINFHEVNQLRQSFFVTLLNMLHSRINYDETRI
ncbi:MAG: HDIG domain-containing protein [Puniceicoccales bacterium]|jgi:putative nucleotidyltransferase with HDIG domain|nr:HDIG domain-containing protein [Puniceicoccales bacterium]